MIPMFKDMWRRFDYEQYGGTPLLGVDGAVVKAHGRSKAAAIASALRVARDFARRKGVAMIREELVKRGDAP
jgi:glycerol-3-phosphate acyltransferase PlsX